MADKMMQCAALGAMLIIFMASVSGYQVRFDDRDYNKRWHMSRRNYCVDSAGKCFSSGQCCDGLICAAFDDYYGQKPEVPGYCVKEKDLEMCVSEGDCPMGSRCVELGRTGERYCLPRSGSHSYPPQPQLLRTYIPTESEEKEDLGNSGSKGLGAECSTTSDCKSISEFSQTKLCCQDVRRGRQGVRRICDRITAISICL